MIGQGCSIQEFVRQIEDPFHFVVFTDSDHTQEHLIIQTVLRFPTCYVSSTPRSQSSPYALVDGTSAGHGAVSMLKDLGVDFRKNTPVDRAVLEVRIGASTGRGDEWVVGRVSFFLRSESGPLASSRIRWPILGEKVCCLCLWRCVFERYVAVCSACATRTTGYASFFASAIFWLPMLWAAIFSMAKKSSAERTIVVVRILLHTCVLQRNWL